MSTRPTTRGLGTRSQNSKNVPANKKLHNENLARPPLPGRVSTTSSFLRDTTNKVLGLKRKAETSNDENKVTKKRAAFGDITNAIEKKITDGKKAAQKERLLSNVSLKTQTRANKLTSKDKTQKLPSIKKENTDAIKIKKEPVPEISDAIKIKKEPVPEISFCESLPSSQDTLTSSQESYKNIIDAIKSEADDSEAYVTASEGRYCHNKDSKQHKGTRRRCVPLSLKLSLEDKESPKPVFPEGVDDYDKEMENDPYAVANYVKDIFSYYKEREKAFSISKYIETQHEVSKSMRSILVDWMVEVQESFELNHETLYLAVKIVDLYLSKKVIKRDHLQLLGSTALFIACKFDERTPPYADDFLYICDDAYKRKELLSMEITVLKVIGFDLGVPLSYRFLRRYARCAKVSMEDLTLSRYILEMSLMDYDLIDASDSAVAAAALFFARIIKGDPTWSTTLQHYSGYTLEDLYHLVHHLHNMMSQPPKDHLKTIRNKYSHKVFFEVAKIPIPESLNI